MDEKMKTRVKITLTAATILLATSAGALALEPNGRFDSNVSGRPAAIKAIESTFGQGAGIVFDDHLRIRITGLARSGKFRAPALADKAPMRQAPDIHRAAADVLSAIRPILWGDRTISPLETRVESSRFGHQAFMTITLDGAPVIDQVIRIQADQDGVVQSVSSTLPATFDGLTVIRDSEKVTMAAAMKAICDHAAARYDGLICPKQVQRVWFRDGMTLVPGGRMLLRSADMGSLLEAIVDLRTGEIVRFAELARR